MLVRLPLAVLAVALSSGCGLGFSLPLCKPFSSPPAMVCALDGGSAMRATMFLSASNAKCAVAADAGVLSLTVSGTDCSAPSNNPVVPITNVSCDLTGVPPGTYTLPTTPSGPDIVVTLPLGGSDAGVDNCP